MFHWWCFPVNEESILQKANHHHYKMVHMNAVSSAYCVSTFTEKVERGVDESCGWTCLDVTCCPQQPTHNSSLEESLSAELQELQTCRESKRLKSTTPPNRIKLFNNVVWAQVQSAASFLLSQIDFFLLIFN